MKKNIDKPLELGKYDEAELLELVDADGYGASWPAATVTLVSSLICPTTACSSRCGH